MNVAGDALTNAITSTRWACHQDAMRAVACQSCLNQNRPTRTAATTRSAITPSPRGDVAETRVRMDDTGHRIPLEEPSSRQGRHVAYGADTAHRFDAVSF